MRIEAGRLPRDKTLIARQFLRCAATYESAAIVQREMAQRLVHMVERTAAPDQLGGVLELGCGTGLLTTLLTRRFPIRHLVLNDLASDLHRVARRCTGIRPELHVELRPGDMESVVFPAEQDLVAANAALQWTADLGTTLERMLATLKPNGLLAVATFGPSNLHEISTVTGHSLRYYPLPILLSRLSLHADVLECHEQERVLWFESAFALLQHLKQTGVNSLRHETWSPGAVRAFCRAYESRFRTAAGVPLTYHPLAWVARRRNTF